MNRLVSLPKVLLMVILTQTLSAQDYNRFAPKLPPPPRLPEGKIVPLPETPVDSLAPQEITGVLLEDLRGIVLIADKNELRPEGLPHVEGIHIASSLTLLQGKDFAPRLELFLHKSLSLDDLNRIVKVITTAYQEKGYPVVDAIVLPQDITPGVLQIVVLEGHVGKVTVEGSKWFSAAQMRQDLRVKTGDPIQSKKMMSDLDWLNANPFRTVDLLYAKGDEMGTTDIIMRSRENFPARFYTGYEDTGSNITGYDRWQGGVNWGNAWGVGHLLNYQYTTSSDFSRLSAHSGSYTIPLPWRHRFTLLGSYSETRASVPPITLTGKSWQASARYEIPLPNLGSYQHRLTPGFDFKQSNSNLDFGGVTQFTNPIDVAQWTSEYSGSLNDAWGKTSGRLSITYSPGGWADHARTSDYSATRSEAKAQYLYGQFGLNRQTDLPYGFEWQQEFVYQVADGNLLNSEQLGLGGRDTVRGYEDREVNGDEGWRVREELRLPRLEPLAALFPRLQDDLVFLGFWDYGVAMNKKLLANENPNIELSGVGVGLRYHLLDYLSVQTDYGFQLTSTELDSQRKSRWHLGILISY